MRTALLFIGFALTLIALVWPRSQRQDYSWLNGAVASHTTTYYGNGGQETATINRDGPTPRIAGGERTSPCATR